MKKSIDKIAGGSAPGGTQSPGLMSGMGSPGMMAGGMGMQQGPHAGTVQNPVGAPPSIVGEGFSQPGTLPSPDSSLVSKPSNTTKCTSCGSDLRPNAKFCTNCGSKT